jgi:hypothetical protein
MPLPDITFYGDGDWGTGKGALLTATEVDDNFWNLHSRLVTIETALPTPISIDQFIVEGNLLTIRLTDNSIQGPFVLPAGQWQWFGDWLPGIELLVNYVITFDGAVYLVLVQHTSVAPFDPGRVIGTDAVYQLLLAKPNQPYDAAFYIEGLVPGSQPLGIHLACRRFSINDDFTGSVAGLNTAPTADMTIPIYKRDDDGDHEVATILFGAGETVGTIVAAASYTPVPIDRLEYLIIGPLIGTADATAAGLAVTIAGIVAAI